MDNQNKLEKPTKIEISGLHRDGINFIEGVNENLIFSCGIEEIILYNVLEGSKKILSSNNDELTCLKYFSSKETNSNEDFTNVSGHLFAGNGQFLQVYDLNSFKQISKYKFNKDAINSIESNDSRSCLALGDDSGEIKIIDLRMKEEKLKGQLTISPVLTNRKSFSGHRNICSSVLFNPSNEFEIFSSSFDCTIMKWDMRSPKSSNNKSNLAKEIKVSEDLIPKENDLNEEFLISSMTPCFVHCMRFFKYDQRYALLAGVENGVCMVYDPQTCEKLCNEQLQSFNCALTQLNQTKSDLIFSQFVQSNNLIVSGGNGKTIEFSYIESINKDESANSLSSFKLKKIDDVTINHNQKINSLFCIENKIFVADTTDDLTIYDF